MKLDACRLSGRGVVGVGWWLHVVVCAIDEVPGRAGERGPSRGVSRQACRAASAVEMFMPAPGR